MPRERPPASGYRSAGPDEDGRRCAERTWNREVERERDPAASGGRPM
ncbi:hypothetical protein [Nocardiopsis lambiniae]|uniref:Uncharacterized protein n=1 Tax=Nocardiopsis lambiniae TaxID=3075539 RepID=A0ABU2M9P8_9ACTN|nr:hypothetical protein [Nocardiopsis sp. DSM 44743]MDT0329389.1 hypothetical protein [Nocardiopsis sp. DSM 44743]